MNNVINLDERRRRRDSKVRITIDQQALDESMRLWREQAERMRAAFASLGQVVIEVRRNAQTIQFQMAPAVRRGWCKDPTQPAAHLASHITWAPGQQNWQLPEFQFPREECPSIRVISPLEAQIAQLWRELAESTFPMPTFDGFNFAQYANDDDPSWCLAPGWRSR